MKRIETILLGLFSLAFFSCSSDFAMSDFLEYKDNHGLFTQATAAEIAEPYAKLLEDGKITKFSIFISDESFIPLERNRYMQYLVPVSVNGREKKFIFDTGSSSISLSRDTAKEFGFSDIDDIPDYCLFPKEINLGFGKYEYQYTDSFAYYCSDDGIMTWLAYAGHADLVTIDIPGERLILNGTKPKGEGLPLSEKALSLGRIQIPVEIEGHMYQAVLDTGWSKDALSRSETSYLPFDETERTYKDYSGYWGRLRGFAHTYHVDEFSVDGIRLHGFDVTFLSEEYTDESLENDLKELGADLFLGYDFFKQCRLTIDYANRRCWVELTE